ncbi:MAG: hypothetical protein HQ569_02725 [Actinobacteria bacterium]|nr:hypothetical protein [Actinomycetota bacterium]
MKKIVGIIEARMSLSRLPGKVMKKIFEKPLLELLIERLKRAKMLDIIVVGACNGLFAKVRNSLLQKWGISFAILSYFILQ